MIQKIATTLFLVTILVVAAGDPDAIFQAIASDDDASIGEILRSDTSNNIINRVGPGGQTPLMNAVLSGKVKAVSILLKAGANTAIPEKDGYTPMV